MSNVCGSSSGNVPILRQGSVVFSTMSLLLGLDAGGARHVLPDPGRLPSSHQGQKIHRLLLGIPFPGSPLGTARYLVKTTHFSFFRIQRAGTALASWFPPCTSRVSHLNLQKLTLCSYCKMWSGCWLAADTAMVRTHESQLNATHCQGNTYLPSTDQPPYGKAGPLLGGPPEMGHLP